MSKYWKCVIIESVYSNSTIDTVLSETSTGKFVLRSVFIDLGNWPSTNWKAARSSWAAHFWQERLCKESYARGIRPLAKKSLIRCLIESGNGRMLVLKFRKWVSFVRFGNTSPRWKITKNRSTWKQLLKEMRQSMSGRCTTRFIACWYFPLTYGVRMCHLEHHKSLALKSPIFSKKFYNCI